MWLLDTNLKNDNFLCYFQHSAVPRKTIATSTKSSCQSEDHCRLLHRETFLSPHCRSESASLLCYWRRSEEGLTALETGWTLPAGDLWVPECESLPADFEPVKWNSWRQWVLHLNQKLEGRTNERTCHFWLNTLSTSDHRCHWVIHLIQIIYLLAVSQCHAHTHTQVAPLVRRRQCSPALGLSASGGFLCGAHKCHPALPGSAPSVPVAPGSWKGLRRAPSCFLTYTNTHSQGMEKW